MRLANQDWDLSLMKGSIIKESLCFYILFARPLSKRIVPSGPNNIDHVAIVVLVIGSRSNSR